MWEIYTSAFTSSASKSAQEQLCYDETRFFEDLVDPDFVKFIARIDGDVGGFVMMTNDLEKARIAYVSPEYFMKQFPKEYADGSIYYCTALAVPPDLQKKHGLFHHLTPLVTKFTDETQSLFVADYSESSIPWLPAALMHDVAKAQKDLCLRTQDADLVELDAQKYFMIRLKP